MSEPVSTTGRAMTNVLAAALDDLSGPDRSAARRAFAESTSPVLGRLHRALATELVLVELREQDLGIRLDRELRADRDALPQPPLPTATGPPAFGVVEADGTTRWQPLPGDEGDTPGLPDVPPAP